MNYNFLELPNWLVFILFQVISWVVLMLVTLLLRKVSHRCGFNDSDSDVIDTATQNAMSGVYVVLGFVLVLVMTTSNEVDSNIAKEASQIESLDRLLVMEGSPPALLARQSLLVYAKSIVRDEWESLAGGTGSRQTRAYANGLFKDIEGIKPNTSRQVILYAEIIKRNDEIEQSRNLRTLSSKSRLPNLFWGVSFFSLLGVIVIAAMRLRQPTTISIIALGVQVGMVALLFTAVMILDLPFLGQTKASSEPISKTIQVIEARN